MSEETTITSPVQTSSPIPLGRRGVELSTYEDAFRFAKSVVLSGFAPKGMEKPESVLVAMQLGLEVGLTPMAALQNIGVINGRPGIFGDAALALVRSSGLLESYEQKYEGTGDALTAVVTVKRKGDPCIVSQSFGVADAKLAGLWGKQGPWSQYPRRMLLFRARGFALRDAFGDVLKGLRTTEELADIPPEKNVTGTGDDIPPPTFLTANQAPVDRPAVSTEGATVDKKPELKQEAPADTLPLANQEKESPAEQLLRLAAKDGIDVDDVEAWAKERKLTHWKNADAQKMVNAWATISKAIKSKKDAANEPRF